MKVLIVLAALVAAACALTLPSEAEVKQHWGSFKATHKKAYATPEEEAHRMKIFKENLIRVTKHNERFDKGEVTFRVGINANSDLHTHEVVEKLNGFRMDMAKKSGIVHESTPLAAPLTAKIDWRQKGLVTPVKDQGQCGSCWSFSATGSLEGQIKKKTGKLVSISEQNLVDCSSSYGNDGCNGGLMDSAFQYVKANGGIDSEASYPYKARDGRCQYKAANSVATASGFVDVKATENDLASALATVGPISVAIDASNWSFQNYESGIYYEPSCSSQSLDHGVLLVGSGPNYWIVKNSWGSSWGEQGYIRMSRNKKNNCGIATMASYPTV